MVKIPESVKNYMRQLTLDPSEMISRAGSELDICYSDNDVPWHTDNDGSDKTMQVCVLICVNDGDRFFYHIDMSPTKIKPGTILMFDGSKEHAVLSAYKDRPKRFAAIIWDVPILTTADQMEYELQYRINEIEHSIGPESIDVLQK